MRTFIVNPNPAHKSGRILAFQNTPGGSVAALPLTFSRSGGQYVVDENGLLRWVEANVPPITGTGGIQANEATTNLFLHSNAFDNAAWVKGAATLTPNAALDPEGKMNAWRLQIPAGSWFFYQVVAQVIGLTYTHQFYIKSAGGGLDTFRLYGNSSGSSDQTATSQWQVFSQTQAAATTSKDFGLRSSTANAGLDVYIWQSQMEQKSYASPIVPTTTSTATRGAHSISRTGMADQIGQSEGSFLWRGKFGVEGNAINLYDGTSNNRIFLQFSGANLRAYVYKGGVEQVAIIAAVSSSYNQDIAIAFAWANNDFALAFGKGAGGSIVGTDNSGVTFSGELNQMNTTYGVPFVGTIKQFELDNTRLSNADLIAWCDNV